MSFYETIKLKQLLIEECKKITPVLGFLVKSEASSISGQHF